MNGGDDARGIVGQQERHAVGGQDDEREVALGGDEGVGGLDRSGDRSVHRRDGSTVYLVHPHETLGRQTDLLGETTPIGLHVRRVVTDVITEIEGIVGRFGHASGA